MKIRPFKFKAEGRVIWKEPVETKKSDGSSTFSLGFPVAEVNSNITNPEEIAKGIAAAMNAYPHF